MRELSPEPPREGPEPTEHPGERGRQGPGVGDSLSTALPISPDSPRTFQEELWILGLWALNLDPGDPRGSGQLAGRSSVRRSDPEKDPEPCGPGRLETGSQGRDRGTAGGRNLKLQWQGHRVGEGRRAATDPQPRRGKQERVAIPRKTLRRRGVRREVVAPAPQAQALFCLAQRLHQVSRVRSRTWGVGQTQRVQGGPVSPRSCAIPTTPTHPHSGGVPAASQRR